MASRVLQRENRSPGMAEHDRRIESEMFTNGIEIGHLGFERHVLRMNARGGLSAASLIVVDQTISIGEPIEIGHEIAMIEIRSAVQNDDRGSLADLARIQLCARDSYMAFMRAALSGAICCQRESRWPRCNRYPRDD